MGTESDSSQKCPNIMNVHTVMYFTPQDTKCSSTSLEQKIQPLLRYQGCSGLDPLLPPPPPPPPPAVRRDSSVDGTPAAALPEAAAERAGSVGGAPIVVLIVSIGSAPVACETITDGIAAAPALTSVVCSIFCRPDCHECENKSVASAAE
jgi:hypothetical protein